MNVSMQIRCNTLANKVYTNLQLNYKKFHKTTEKIASGKRINSAGDDASGLAISQKMRAQIEGLKQARRNTQDAISILQTADGAMDESLSVVHRMRVLVVQGCNGTLSQPDREMIQNEINQITDEIERITESCVFNTKKILMENSNVPRFTIHVGPDENQVTDISVEDVLYDAIEEFKKVNVLTQKDAESSLTRIDEAMRIYIRGRFNLGAHQNRLEKVMEYLYDEFINLSATESRIKDADIALTMMDYTKNRLLYNYSIAHLIHSKMHNTFMLELIQRL